MEWAWVKYNAELRQSKSLTPGDELLSHRAYLLNASLLLGIAFTLLVTIGNILGGRTPILVDCIDSGISLACILLLYWLRRRHYLRSALCFMGLILGGTVGSIVRLGSARTPTSAVFLLLVLLSGILFDRRGLVVTTILSSLALLALVAAERAGLLPQAVLTVTINQWVTYTAIFMIGGGLTHMAFFSARQALSRADHEIAERRRGEQALLSTTSELQAALASMSDAVFISDARGNFTTLNEAFATFHRFRDRDEYFRTLAEYPAILDVFFPGCEKAPLESWAVSRALRGETAVGAEYSLLGRTRARHG